MNKQEKKRLNFFKKYSKNFKLIRDKLGSKMIVELDGKEVEFPDEVYLCPICFEPFFEKDIYESKSNFLTLEDVPPQSLGGKQILLTCKNCNNESGRVLDNLLKMSMETEQVFKRKTKAPIKTRFQIGESNIGGTLNYNKEKGFEMNIIGKSNPNAKTDINDFFENWGKASMNMKFTAPNHRKVGISLLRIAYLKMIEHFCCCMYLEENVLKIRDQLFNPDDEIIKTLSTFNFTFKKENIGIHIITEPVKYATYLVIFSTHLTGYEKINCIPFPGPYKTGMESYENLKKMNEKIDFNIKPLTGKIDWLNEDYLFEYFVIWNDYIITPCNSGS